MILPSDCGPRCTTVFFTSHSNFKGGVETKTHYLGVRMLCSLMGQFQGALCLANDGEWKTKDSPCCSRMGGHLPQHDERPETTSSCWDLACPALFRTPRMSQNRRGQAQELSSPSAAMQMSNESVDPPWVTCGDHTVDSSLPRATAARHTGPSSGACPHPSCSKSLWRVSSTISSMTSGFKMSLI